MTRLSRDANFPQAEVLPFHRDTVRSDGDDADVDELRDYTESRSELLVALRTCLTLKRFCEHL